MIIRVLGYPHGRARSTAAYGVRTTEFTDAKWTRDHVSWHIFLLFFEILATLSRDCDCCQLPRLVLPHHARPKIRPDIVKSQEPF